MYGIVCADFDVYGGMALILCNDGMGYGCGMIHKVY